MSKLFQQKASSGERDKEYIFNQDTLQSHHL